jgi:transposase InsO family protein
VYPIATMCRVLGVSPGGYYAHRKRLPSARACADAELRARIAAIHRRSRETYGAPRIHAELKEQDIRVGCKRVARLMRAAAPSWREPAQLDSHHGARSPNPAGARLGRAQLRRPGA